MCDLKDCEYFSYRLCGCILRRCINLELEIMNDCVSWNQYSNCCMRGIDHCITDSSICGYYEVDNMSENKRKGNPPEEEVRYGRMVVSHWLSDSKKPSFKVSRHFKIGQNDWQQFAFYCYRSDLENLVKACGDMLDKVPDDRADNDSDKNSK